MKVLKILCIIFISLIAIVVVLGLIAPKNYQVERSAVVPSKNKEVIFKNISIWSEFIKWNPWSELDPNQKVTFKGAEGTVGSSYSWSGNDSVGVGEMTITKLVPNETVESDLHFIKPFESKNKTVMSMTPEADGYKVTWQMRGSTPFPMNIMNLFISMDKMIGKDFEKGLNSLKEKSVKESEAATPPAEIIPNDTDSTTKAKV